MHVHVLQHVPFEGLGSIEAGLSQQAARITYTRFYESATLPPLDDIDFVIALGGPMSVNDESDLPWLRDEKRFVAAAIAAGKIVLGICLGAQLIADVLGSRVYQGAHREIGWFPIAGTADGSETFRFPADATVFHWHGETFDLPEGAVRLASSAVCPNQAFQFGPRVIALQFHLEMTQDAVALILDHCAGELVAQPYVQPEAALRNAPAAHYAAINALMGQVLAYLTGDTH